MQSKMNMKIAKNIWKAKSQKECVQLLAVNEANRLNMHHISIANVKFAIIPALDGTPVANFKVMRQIL